VSQDRDDVMEAWTRWVEDQGVGGTSCRRVADAVGRYLSHADDYYRRADRSRTGEASTLRSALASLVALYGKLHPNDLRAVHLEAYRQSLIQRGLCRSSINAYTNRLRRWARWCVVHDLMNPGVSQAWQSLRNIRRGRSQAAERPPVEPVPFEDVEKAANVMPDVPRAMVMVLWHTAARPSELCGMTVEDLDATGTTWRYGPPQHKTSHHNQERTILFGPQARQWLAPRVAAAQCRGGGLVFSPGWRRPGVVSTPQTMTPARLRACVSWACAEAGVPHWTPYQLRHSALERIESDFGRTGAMRVAGHSAAGTTEHYIRQRKLNEQQATEILEVIG
tara:strand:- start:1673 stop:2677 length:1005 start_codon:yes stop_codon:yes gene_type:complete